MDFHGKLDLFLFISVGMQQGARAYEDMALHCSSDLVVVTNITKTRVDRSPLPVCSLLVDQLSTRSLACQEAPSVSKQKTILSSLQHSSVPAWIHFLLVVSTQILKMECVQGEQECYARV